MAAAVFRKGASLKNVGITPPNPGNEVLPRNPAMGHR